MKENAMARKILAGNWKMHKTREECRDFFKDLTKNLEKNPVPKGLSLMTAVPATLIGDAVDKAPDGVWVLGQNVHFEKQGAFTGEISAAMLKDSGANGTLIGHSERRQYFGETDATVAKKTRAALNGGLSAIVCIGETLEERDGGRTEAVLAQQLKGGLEGVPYDPALVIAYEPVWAIGTGKTATPEMAQAAHKFIRGQLAELFGADHAEAIPILYGGSMKPGNVAELTAEADIDGGLVGGASLSPDDFAEMVTKFSL